MQSCLFWLIDQVRIFLERRVTVLPHRMLQLRNRCGIEQVILAAHAVLIVAAHGQLGIDSVTGWNA